MTAGAQLQLYNSLGRELQDFTPIHAGQVRLYTCGLTVYNYAHLGNLRAYLFTDTLRRVLQWKGYDVCHVMNITDVGHLTSDADEGEDKVEKAAKAKGSTVWELTEYYTRDFQNNLKRLHIMPPSVWSKATDHIQEMIEYAWKLSENGYTYELPDGLYFDTSKLPDYGKLGLLDLEGQQGGIRVSDSAKHNPQDFAVWRRSPEDEQRLMEWRSPWGVGVPGWHLECSVMSIKYLGAPFDIHTGGIDHRQVHHVNEIAQNQGVLGHEEPGANWWMHNEFLVMSGEKMAKSAGGFLRVETLLDWGIHPLVYRWFTLMAHYRKALEFSLDALIAAKNGLSRLLRRIAVIKEKAGAEDSVVGGPCSQLVGEARFSRGASFAFQRRCLEQGLSKKMRPWIEKLDAALSGDLNTAQATGLLQDLVSAKKLPAAEVLRVIAVYDLALGLGLLSLDADELNLRPASATATDDEIAALIRARAEARAAKEWAEADRVRDALAEAGVELRDGGSATDWEWIPRA